MILGIFIAYTGAKAQEENVKNPYDSAKFSVRKILVDYHEHVNKTFNTYIALMLEAQEKSAKKPGAADDPNGKPLDSAADCSDPANNKNYSTFCLSVNLLGGNSDECNDKSGKTRSDDFRKFCELNKGAEPLKGYLNFKAALEKKRNRIFETAEEESGQGLRTQRGLIATVTGRQETIDKEITIAKATLDQALSAYDQLRLAWPMHVRYKQIYKDLETYRDKLVDIRQQTDAYPSKFIDLTTTKCL